MNACFRRFAVTGTPRFVWPVKIMIYGAWRDICDGAICDSSRRCRHFMPSLYKFAHAIKKSVNTQPEFDETLNAGECDKEH